jgi:hypothetical protein
MPAPRCPHSSFGAACPSSGYRAAIPVLRPLRPLRPAVVAALAFALAPAGATAQEPLPHLIVTRDPGSASCPDANGLAWEVARLNGRPAVDPAQMTLARTRLHVEITRGLDGFRAVIRAHGARPGERSLSDVGPGCENLADALALTLALVVDTSREGTVVVHPIDQDLDEARDRRDRASRAHGEAPLFDMPPTTVHAGVAAAFNAIDGLGALAFVDGELWLGEVFSLGLGGVFVFPERVALGPGSVTASILGGAVRPCATLLGGRAALRFAACAQAMIGALAGEGLGFNEDTHQTSLLWTAVGGGLLAEGPVAGLFRWSARALAYGVPGALRFTVDGIDDDYPLPRAGGFLGGGLAMVFE